MKQYYGASEDPAKESVQYQKQQHEVTPMISLRDEKSGKPIGNGKWKVVEDDFGPNTVNFGT